MGDFCVANYLLKFDLVHLVGRVYPRRNARPFVRCLAVTLIFCSRASAVFAFCSLFPAPLRRRSALHLFSSCVIWMPNKAAPVAESPTVADKFASWVGRARFVVGMQCNMIKRWCGLLRRGNGPHPRSIDAAKVSP
jgi:hypothetical protein